MVVKRRSASAADHRGGLSDRCVPLVQLLGFCYLFRRDCRLLSVRCAVPVSCAGERDDRNGSPAGCRSFCNWNDCCPSVYNEVRDDGFRCWHCQAPFDAVSADDSLGPSDGARCAVYRSRSASMAEKLSSSGHGAAGTDCTCRWKDAGRGGRAGRCPDSGREKTGAGRKRNGGKAKKSFCLL